MATVTTNSLMRRRPYRPKDEAKWRLLTQENGRHVGRNITSGRARTRKTMRVVAGLTAVFASTLSNAQSLSPETPPADTARPANTWRFTPEISVTESFTDNAALAPDTIATSSWVTETTPGIRIEQTGVRSRFFLDYRLHNFNYTSESRLNSSQNLLNSNAIIEAIDNWLFIDASAYITQENRSAFSPSGATNVTGLNRNKIETTTLQISPYIRGRVADVATYQLRFVGVDIRTDDPTLPDTKGTNWTGFMKGERTFASVGWTIDGKSLNYRNDVVGNVGDARIRGSLYYEFSPQLHASAIVGREVTDFLGTRNSSNTSGMGLEWSPDVRTQFAAVKERRFFGDGHIVSLSHRTALSVWKFTSSKDVTAMTEQLTTTGPGSTAALLAALLVSAIPDPVAREAAVRQGLESSGIPSSSALSGGFATGRPYLIRNDEASVALRGVYNTVTLAFSRRDQQALGPSNGALDSFSLSNDIRQEGANLNWAYRLSPISSVSLVATYLRSKGLSTTNLDTKERTLNLLFSTRLGLHTYAAFGVRRAQFDDLVNTGHRENAVLVSLSLRY